MDNITILKNGVPYNVPGNLQIKDDVFVLRSDAKDKAFAHGGIDIADGKIKIKVIRIEGTVYLQPTEATRASYLTLVQAIKAAFCQTDYMLYLGSDHFIMINKALKFSEEYLDAHDYQGAKFTIDLLAIDPFWYYDDEQEKTQIVTSTPKSFVVNNQGYVETFPVITITATGTLPDFTLENETDVQESGDGLKFRYTDPGLFIGNVVVIDCKEGTVKRGATNYIRYFAGAFLKLLPGNNTLTYTGADCTVKVAWFERLF